MEWSGVKRREGVRALKGGGDKGKGSKKKKKKKSRRCEWERKVDIKDNVEDAV